MLTDMETCYKVMRTDVLRSMELQVERVRHRAGNHRQGLQAALSRLRGADQLRRPRLRRGQEDHLARRRRRAVGAGQVPLHRIAERRGRRARREIPVHSLLCALGDLCVRTRGSGNRFSLRRRQQTLPRRRQVLHPAVVDDRDRQHALPAHAGVAGDRGVSRRCARRRPARRCRRSSASAGLPSPFGSPSTTSMRLENLFDT